MKRFKVNFWMDFYAAGENRQEEGECYMNAEKIEVIEQTAFVNLAETVIKQGIVLKGLKILEIEEAIQIPDNQKGETVKKEFEVNVKKEENKDGDDESQLIKP